MLIPWTKWNPLTKGSISKTIELGITGASLCLYKQKTSNLSVVSCDVHLHSSVVDFIIMANLIFDNQDGIYLSLCLYVCTCISWKHYLHHWIPMVFFSIWYTKCLLKLLLYVTLPFIQLPPYQLRTQNELMQSGVK